MELSVGNGKATVIRQFRVMPKRGLRLLFKLTIILMMGTCRLAATLGAYLKYLGSKAIESQNTLQANVLKFGCVIKLKKKCLNRLQINSV